MSAKQQDVSQAGKNAHEKSFHGPHEKSFHGTLQGLKPAVPSGNSLPCLPRIPQDLPLISDTARHSVVDCPRANADRLYAQVRQEDVDEGLHLPLMQPAEHIQRL